MWAVGALLVLLGLCALVIGGLMSLWSGSRARGKKLAFYGTVAFVFGLVPTAVLEPPEIAVRAADEEVDVAPVAIAAPRAQLRLGSWRCYEEYGFQHVEGRVTNQTDRPLSNVMIVATFETSSGQLVKNDRALVEYQPLMPGQTSPFTLLSSGNPQIRRCEISFQIMAGPALSLER